MLPARDTKEGDWKLQAHKLQGSDRVVDELLPESYVKWWISALTPKTLQKYLGGNGYRVTDDVRSLMQAELDRRVQAKAAKSQGADHPPAPQQEQVQRPQGTGQ